jgi:hypothetical protein
MNETLKRTGVIVGVVVLAAAVLVAAMFVFGKPVTPQASSQATPVGTTDPPAGTADPVDSASAGGSDPLAVEIPGCVCHSDDPAVVESHASYRMSECFDCHSEGMPGMGM